VKYVIVSELGSSTLGSVTKVKKRTPAVGGSAPKQAWGQFDCFKLNPLVGGLFRFCLEGTIEMSDSEQSNREDDNAARNYTNDQDDQGARDDSFYALKTIHLNSVKDETLIERLKSETQVLKTLVHPNSKSGNASLLYLRIGTSFSCFSRFCMSYSSNYIRDVCLS